jgi:ketosteroid isomerase-like protein
VRSISKNPDFVYGEVMRTTRPAETAADLFACMNARDEVSFVSLLAKDAVFHFPGTRPIEGDERIGRFLKILFSKYPKLVFDIGRIVADASCAAVEWTNKGETGDGVPYRNAGVTVIEIRGDRIVYLSDTFKDTSFFIRSAAVESGSE